MRTTTWVAQFGTTHGTEMPGGQILMTGDAASSAMSGPPLYAPSNLPLFPLSQLLTAQQPDIDECLLELALWDPYHYDYIRQMHDSIHSHVLMGYDRDGPESFFLSREVEKLSRLLQKMYRHDPWQGRGLGDLARELKLIGRDVQIGPRRRKYHPRPRPRYWDGSYYPGDGWWRGRR